MKSRHKDHTSGEAIQEQDLDELKNRLVTMANHEFRTPLTGIASSADLIEAYMDRGNYEQVRKHILRIKNCVNEMNNIVTDVLALTKLNESNIVPHFRELDLPELIGALIDDFKHLLKSGQSIQYQHTGSAIVDLDSVLLKNALLNLLSNASRYSPPDAPIQINTAVSPKTTMISITDQGIGIPSEDQEFIFDRFFRAKNVTNIQGTGLGLYLAKCYVEIMNSTIGLTSELGNGATFWIMFKEDK